jgi:peptidoglycan/xylan/chitin deacetylase (PgdA/CDA1 family)
VQELSNVTADQDGAIDPDYFLRERYAAHESRPLLAPYYALKPLLPRRVQLALRRQYARKQSQRRFPRWPVEDVLVRHQEESFQQLIHANGGEPVAFVNFWPDGHRFAYVLTHDVEGPVGVYNIARVREVERAHGMVSSWNFVADDYAIPTGLFDELRADGCEVGLHGIHHDRSLFRDEESFTRTLPLIHRYLDEWGAVGFRSPATYRDPDWMPRLGALYDSSFPDTDPFEPQAGGCCSIFPYFLDDLIELPITLVQDHTMWEILRHPGIDLWLEKTDWLRENHGLVNVIVHPDYLVSDERLQLYDQFLTHLERLEDGWHALPCEVASWWRARDGMEVAPDGASVDGADGWPATVAHATAAGEGVVYEVCAPVAARTASAT